MSNQLVPSNGKDESLEALAAMEQMLRHLYGKKEKKKTKDYTYEKMEFVRSGTQFIIPEGMTYRQAMDALAQKEKEENTAPC